MGKDNHEFTEMDAKEDTGMLYKVKTTKGTTGFGRNTIKKVVPKEILLIFINFFDKRNILARKINKQLVESGLPLWEREYLLNFYETRKGHILSIVLLLTLIKV